MGQLLKHVEEMGQVEESALLPLISATECVHGHELHIQATARLLEKADDSSLRLSAAGEDWLIRHGHPAPDWHIQGPPGIPELRQWQRDALDAWARHGRHGVVEAVTGTGKSRVGVEAIREAVDHDFDVIVLVPTRELVEQWERTLRTSGIKSVGRFGADGYAAWRDHRVLVGTIQSVYPNPPRRPDGKVLVVADECHRYGAREWSRALDDTYRRRLGLTATFERNDEGIGLLNRYFGGTPVYKIGFHEAIAADVVAHYDVKLMGVDLTSQERHVYDQADERLKDCRIKLIAAGFTAEPFGAFMTEVQAAADDHPDPTVHEVARRYMSAFSKRVDVMAEAANKLEAMRHLAPGVAASKGTLVFTRRKEAAEDLALVLRDEGVAAHAIHSDLTHPERRARLTGLKTGAITALVAPTVLDEGVDVPDVDLGIVMSGSKSRRQMIQRMGRVMRRKADGRKATFVVVYARGTGEDLTVSNGQEGALDLIVDSADSVAELEWDGEQLVETPLRREPGASAQSARVVTTALPSSRIDSTQVAIPHSSDARPERLRAMDPGVTPIASRAVKQYARERRVPEKAAKEALQMLLADLLDAGRVYALQGPLEAYAIRGDQDEIVVTNARVVSYRRYGLDPAATRHHAARPDSPPPDPHRDATVVDELVPAVMQVTGEALEMVCDVFELGDLKMSDALSETRALLTLDLATGPTVTEEDTGYAITCLLATWHVDPSVAQILAVEGNLPARDDADDDLEPCAGQTAQPVEHDAPVEDCRGHAEVEQVQSAPSSTVAVPEPIGLVEQLERIAALHAQGVLTDAEFAAAKAKVLA